MITVTWIIAILAVTSLTVGIIVTIVVRTEITTNWKRIGKVLIWIIGLIIFRFVIWGFVHHYQKESNKQVQEITPQPIPAHGEVVKNPTLIEYEYSKEDYPGQNRNDDPQYRPPQPTGRAFLITDSPKAMTFRVEYANERGELKSVLFSLDKTLPEQVGVWYQDEPRFSGKWFLKKKQLATGGYDFCLSADSRPDLGWCDGYLRPK